MTYKQIVTLFDAVASSMPGVNSFSYGTVSEDSVQHPGPYPSILLSPATTTREGDLYRFGFDLWYIDSPAGGSADIADIHSAAIETLTRIALSVADQRMDTDAMFSPIEIASGDEIDPSLIGVRCEIYVTTPVPLGISEE